MLLRMLIPGTPSELGWVLDLVLIIVEEAGTEVTEFIEATEAGTEGTEAGIVDVRVVT